MRTTVTLDKDVERLVRDAMHKSRKGFKQTLNDAVRAGLGARSEAKTRPFTVKARALGLRAGIDPAGFNKLADELEAEAVVFNPNTSQSIDPPLPRRRGRGQG